jgi:molybdate transport system ATP-binding protein
MIDARATRRLGSFVLDVEFSTSSRVTALFGRSGSGKTTLVNIIAGIERADTGTIKVDGDVVVDTARGIDVPAHRRRMGYIFQDGRLFPHLSVRSNLEYGQRLVPAGERRILFDPVVGLLGLGGLLERRPGALSGGERQRVAIGRALLTSPRVLLFDEPLAGLDQERKADIMRYIERLRDELQIPMLYVSHAVEEIVRLADTVVLMAAGKAVAVGSVEEVMGRPDLRPAGVFEGGAVLDMKIVARDAAYDMTTLAFDGGSLKITSLAAEVGKAVRVRIRARDVAIALAPPTGLSTQNVMRGRITSLDVESAAIVNVALAVGTHTVRSRITRRAAEDLRLAAGMDVYALIKAVALV